MKKKYMTPSTETLDCIIEDLLSGSGVIVKAALTMEELTRQEACLPLPANSLTLKNRCQNNVS